MPRIRPRLIHCVPRQHECAVVGEERESFVLKTYKTYQSKILPNQGLLRCWRNWCAVLPDWRNVGRYFNQALTRTEVQRHARIPTELPMRLWRRQREETFNETPRCGIIAGVCWCTCKKPTGAPTKSHMCLTNKYSHVWTNRTESGIVLEMSRPRRLRA